MMFLSLQMNTKMCPVSLLLMIALLVFNIETCNGTETQCTANCVCNKEEIKCSEFIPTFIPNGYETLILSEINPAELYPQRYCKLLWSSVNQRIISSVKPTIVQPANGVFDCLEQLQTFRLHSDNVYGFSPNTFIGLTNLTIFDLLGCTNLLWLELFQNQNQNQNSLLVKRQNDNSMCCQYQKTCQTLDIWISQSSTYEMNSKSTRHS